MREPPENLENFDINASLKAYGDMVHFFSERLRTIANNRADVEEFRRLAGHQVNAILAGVYHQYLQFEKQTKRGDGVAKVSIWANQEIEDLLQSGILERYDARKVIIATYFKIRNILK